MPPPKDLEKKLGTYTYNHNKIQSLNSDSCGWFCLMCINYCEDRCNALTSFYKLQTLFSDKSVTNEKLFCTTIIYMPSQFTFKVDNNVHFQCTIKLRDVLLLKPTGSAANAR